MCITRSIMNHHGIVAGYLSPPLATCLPLCSLCRARAPGQTYPRRSNTSGGSPAGIRSTHTMKTSTWNHLRMSRGRTIGLFLRETCRDTLPTRLLNIRRLM
uniref:Uncharacterized protein n=1 Tax=Cacopsylla melanoneura TaxID=428564 RepID=A0A8D9EP23_9HEMI